MVVSQWMMTVIEVGNQLRRLNQKAEGEMLLLPSAYLVRRGLMRR
jgi:hypothetical protein